MTRETASVTRLLLDWSTGDERARDQLMPLVYEELRRLAGAQLRSEHDHHSLQVTDLVNEAYLRLVDQNRVRWSNRIHFFAISARLMRRILVDHARRQRARKRGGDGIRVTLVESAAVTPGLDPDLVALDDALESLAEIDPRGAQLVELRFFAGLTIEETAEVLDISPATVKREWVATRAWLFRRLDSPAETR